VKSFLADGYSVFGWWSPDFEVRRRECPHCGKLFKTIEVATEDLRNAFGEIKQDRTLGTPWQPNSPKDLPPLNASDAPKLNDSRRTESNLCG
jgi:hypothetical protein